MTGADNPEISDSEPLSSASEVKFLIARGAALVAGRGVGVRVIALLGTVILARLLTPGEFGIVALGATIVAFARLLSDGGLGAALIRRVEAPTRREYEALLGLQLTVTVVIAFITAAASSPFGQQGRVVTLMAASLPIAVFQTPGALQLERRLAYGRRIFVELAEVLSYYAWAVVTVIAGYGLMGLATASLARATVGVAVMAAVTPHRVHRPRLDFTAIRALMAFGLRYQAVGAVNLLRDQGLNALTAAVAGVGTLGLWAVAYRVCTVPFLIFEALWRVCYPGMSRLVASGEDMAPLLRKAAQSGVVGGGAVLVPLAVASPLLIPTLFGDQWTGAVPALLPALAGIMVGGPVSVTVAGYLYARGDSQTVLTAALLHTLAWLAVAASLLPHLGVAALGFGWLLASLIDVLVLILGLRKWMPLSTLSPLPVPTTLALTIGALAAWGVRGHFAPTIGNVILVGVMSVALYLLLLRILTPATLASALRTLRMALSPNKAS